MVAISSFVAIAGLAIGAIGTFAQISASKQAASEQRKARAAQRRVQQEQTRRSRLQALRQAQLTRARAQSTGIGIGAGESSGLAGGLSSVSANTGAALGSASQLSGLSNQISVFNQNAADAQSRAQTFGAVAGLGSTIASFAVKNRAFIDGTSGQAATRTPDQPSTFTGLTALNF